MELQSIRSSSFHHFEILDVSFLLFLDFGIIRWHVLYFRWFKPKVNTRWFCILKSVSKSNRATSITSHIENTFFNWGHLRSFFFEFFWLVKACEKVTTCAIIKSLLDYSMNGYERNIFNGIISFDKCSLLMILRHNFFCS